MSRLKIQKIESLQQQIKDKVVREVMIELEEEKINK